MEALLKRREEEAATTLLGRALPRTGISGGSTMELEYL